jgi:purine-binding chemotaxis protein CheW
MTASASLLDQIVAQRQLGDKDIADVDEHTTRMVFFVVGGQLFAVKGASVKEILAYCEMAFVPGCPATMRGVINVRGDIESVVSLAGLLGLPEGEVTRKTSILLADGAGMRSGLIVDAVSDVAEIPDSAIQAVPCTTSLNQQGIMTHTVTNRDKVATMIEIEPLFQNFARGLL